MNKKFNRGNFLRSALWAIVIVVIVLYLVYRGFESTQSATAVREETLERAIPSVTVIVPHPAEGSQSITLPGNLVAWHQAPIYGRVPGYVKDWYTDFGAEVEKGDLLAIIATPILDAEYRMAVAEVKAKEAEYDLAVITANRYTSLGDTKAVSMQSVSEQKANRKVQAAELNKARQHLKNIQARRHFKHIVAPFDGVVIDRNVNVGDYVNETGSLSLKGEDEANLFTVADTTKMRLFVNVPASFGPFLQPGLAADVTVPQLPGRHFTGVYKTSAKGFNVGTRTAVTEFVINNKDGELWPGSYASVHLEAPVDSNALLIPTTAMVFQEEGSAVAVLTEDERIHIQPIKVQHFHARALEVTGISKTDRIVDNPSAYLLEGTKVRVIDKPAEGYIKSPLKSHQEPGESGLPTQDVENETSAESGAQPQGTADNSSIAGDMLPYEVGPYRFDVAIEPKKPVVGKNAVVIYLQNKEGEPVRDASIEAIAEMPAMGSRPAVQVSANIKEVRPGVYGGLIKLPREGSWPLTLRFKAVGIPEQKVLLDMTTGHSGLAVKTNLQSNMPFPSEG